LAVANF